MLTSGCAMHPKTSPHSVKISSDIPVIPAIRWIGDITAIALEWDPNPSPQIAGYNIYRRLKQDSNDSFIRIVKINDRFSSHYVDKHLPQETKYLYTISAFNHEGFESLASVPVSTITRPTLKSVSYFDSLNKLPRKAKLIWRPHDNGRVHAYLVERKMPNEQEWSNLAILDHRLSAEYIDSELDDNKIYLYRVSALTFDNIKSTPSDIVKIVTKAPPIPVTGINTTTNLASTIELRWAKHPQNDIKAYHIYRSENSKDSFSLRAKVSVLNFTDTLKGYANTYFYKISAVDADGLESAMPTSYKGQTLAQPNPVVINEAKLTANTFTLKWSATDNRAVRYQVIKKEAVGWFDIKKTVTDTNNTSYTTIQTPNRAISYEVIAIDKLDIPSPATKTKEFIFEQVVQ